MYTGEVPYGILPTFIRGVEMAMSASKRNRPHPSGHAYGIALPAELHEAIEAERGNLAKAESLLGCLVTAMECESDSATAPYYPDVAQMARELVRQSINGLDSLALHKLLSRNRVKVEVGMLTFAWG